MRSRSSVRVGTDFDNTITPHNMGVVLVAHYLLTNRDSAYDKAHYLLGLAKRAMYGEHLGAYHRILRRMPKAEWRRVLKEEPVNPAWKRAVTRIKRKAGVKTLSVTIISRNTSDVIAEWVAAHRTELDALGVTVEEIIANRPVGEGRNIHVRVRKSVRKAGSGKLDQHGKREYVAGIPYYIGDSGEHVLKPYVKEFYPV